MSREATVLRDRGSPNHVTVKDGSKTKARETGKWKKRIAAFTDIQVRKAEDVLYKLRTT